MYCIVFNKESLLTVSYLMLQLGKTIYFREVRNTLQKKISMKARASWQFFQIEILLWFIKCQGPWILFLHPLYGGVPDGQPEGPLQGKPVGKIKTIKMGIWSLCLEGWHCNKILVYLALEWSYLLPNTCSFSSWIKSNFQAGRHNNLNFTVCAEFEFLQNDVSICNYKIVKGSQRKSFKILL